VKKFVLGGLLFLNCIRLIGLESAPPGFYVDEAAGAAQVLCLKETGADYFHQHLPLFSKGLGGGYYTTPYLYSEVVWTSLFGNSVYAFRALIALVSLLTVLFLFLWTEKRTRLAGRKFSLEAVSSLSLWVAFIATISPWCFQFSRIAWDPPFSVFFLMLGLYAIEWVITTPAKTRAWIYDACAMLAFALAAYSYPPVRVQALLVLWVLPWLTWKKKFSLSLLFFIFMIPLFIVSMDPEFTARARMLILSSSYPMNPYHDASVLGLVFGLFEQMFKHFTPEFLFFKGDANLRHSTGEFGVLSYFEGIVLVLGVCTFARWRKTISSLHRQLLWVGAVGALAGILPAALTWEGAPHALRAIGAWPFFSLFGGTVLVQVLSLIRDSRNRRTVNYALALMGLLFFGTYLKVFFVDYPKIAWPWFQTEPAPFAQVYHRITDEGKTCAELAP
jgi:hypothetical protein